MHRRARITSALVAVAGLSAFAHAQLRVATWNISNYDGTDRFTDIQTAVYGVFQGRSMSPDIIGAQEFGSAAALSTFVQALNTAPGSPGDWAAAPFITGPDTQSVFVYRTSKVAFERAVTIALGSSATTDQPRNTYRYDFRPVGYGAANPANHIGLYSVHLKSGSTSSDISRRLVETTNIRNNAMGMNTNGPGTALPAGYHAIFAGDTNTQSASQSAYVELVGSLGNNVGRFFDPIHCGQNSTSSSDNGSWNNNSAYITIHTQDPTGPGGMDDRHDQILLTSGLIDGQGMDYIGNPNLRFSTSTWNDPNHSYRCWGNDGSSFNASLTTTGNTQVGPTIAQALKNCASTAGGHLPVYLDLRVPPKVGASSLTLDFGTVPQGSVATRNLVVSNAGDVNLWTAAGIANLSYSLVASSGFAAPIGSFIDAPGANGNTHVVSMNTSTPGTFTGTVTINSNDPDVPALVINLTGTVAAPNQPPVAHAGDDITLIDTDFSGDEIAHLDGSASTDDQGIVSYVWTEGSTVLASSAIADVLFAVGTHTVVLTVTDAQGLTGQDSLIVDVVTPEGCNPDFNQDGVIDQGDIDYLINVVAGGENPTGADPDFNHDGVADQGDIDSAIDVVAGGPCP
ncbi:MAG: hypothetical protein GC200_07990 [Tepidisphaera sp.]|nr:hypothetical protein [Tepidisphaera sp.]